MQDENPMRFVCHAQIGQSPRSGAIEVTRARGARSIRSDTHTQILFVTVAEVAIVVFSE